MPIPGWQVECPWAILLAAWSMNAIQFTNPGATLTVPDGRAMALARITHLGIGAHQDDLEFMAFEGILNCYQKADQWFGGVTCTDGAGSARQGRYAHFSDSQMRAVRHEEQERAAKIGQFGVMIQLDYPSASLHSDGLPKLQADLVKILSATHPSVVYTHNLADKHPTHLNVAAAVIGALRELAPQWKPLHFYGCEVWRDLDWMPDPEKVLLDLSGGEELAAALNNVFDSQITGGKQYHVGVQGRRNAHATFLDAHHVDRSTALSFAMDLMPLILSPELNPADYVGGIINRFRAEVTNGVVSAFSAAKKQD